MKKFNYTTLKLVFAITILLGVVFLFYYSCHPFSQFSKGSYLLVEDFINAVFVDESNLFGLEINSTTTLTEIYFVKDIEYGLSVVGESQRFYKYADGKFYINNQLEYLFYGDSYIYKESNRSLLEKIY